MSNSGTPMNGGASGGGDAMMMGRAGSSVPVAGRPGDAGTTSSAGISGSAAGGIGGSGEEMPDDAGSGGMGGSMAGSGGSAGSKSSDGCGTPSELVGWGAVSNGGVSTTGGDGGTTVKVSDFTALADAVKGTDKRVIEIRGNLSGSLTIGSNKTLIGCDGAKLKGHISLNKSANVVIRNLTIVGNDCSDSPDDCSGGDDAITVQGAAHHLWFDHDDISDGSDGNLDLTHAVDFVTISWTKFHYSGKRSDPGGASGGHQFSNLVGHSDDNGDEDTGHLRITFHHDWWADNVVERMPRVRFGQVHIFDNLYTSAGNNYCIGIGVSANVLAENNVFIGVKTPVNTTSYSDGNSIFHGAGNVLMGTSGDMPVEMNAGKVFKPGYDYTLDPTSGLEAQVRDGAGPN
jgi:pectate lyase